MQLFDEQKVILQHVESHAKHMSTRELEQFQLVQRRITEHKWKRNDLVDKQTEILNESENNEQELAQLKEQIENLEGEEDNFRQFIGNLGRMKKKTDQRCDSTETSQTRKPFFSWTPEKENGISNASRILSTLRFLLPLSNRRAGVLSELLRTTEQPLPDQASVVYVDRRTSVKDRVNSPPTSVFYQIFESLKVENMNFRLVIMRSLLALYTR
jgi:septal ring factor EnvC (AmiA/AmiB activator)